MNPQRDCPAWRVVDADTGALVALVESRAEATQIVVGSSDPSKYVIEAPAAGDEGEA